MNKNISSADRIIRIIIFIATAILYFTHTVTGTWGIVLFAVGSVLLLTSVINFCPIYAILGISTRSKK